MPALTNFLRQVELGLPLFLLVFLGFALVRWTSWPPSVSEGLSRFVFSVALPALLFDTMSDLSTLPPVSPRILVAFFGGCLVVFALGRLIGHRLFGMDGVAQSVFAMGGVLSNNLLLGVPLAKALLPPDALPAVALVLIFNSLILWTLVTVSVEFARNGGLTVDGFTATLRGVATNPVVVSIMLGTAYGLTGLPVPSVIQTPLTMTATAATPLALIAVGMGLTGTKVREFWKVSAAITVLKLLVQPLVVWGLATLIGLPTLETQVATLLASIAVGANVYLMARQFAVLEQAVAASLVLSTALASVTVPAALSLIGAGP